MLILILIYLSSHMWFMTIILNNMALEIKTLIIGLKILMNTGKEGALTG